MLDFQEISFVANIVYKSSNNKKQLITNNYMQNFAHNLNI